jgi:hypothetical protein
MENTLVKYVLPRIPKTTISMQMPKGAKIRLVIEEEEELILCVVENSENKKEDVEFILFNIPLERISWEEMDFVGRVNFPKEPWNIFKKRKDSKTNFHLTEK